MSSLPNKTLLAAIQITARRDNGSETTCTLTAENSLIIGSGDACGLTLEGTAVSPRHSLLSIDDGQLMIQAWPMAGDTYLNGQLISEEAALSCTDKVTVGDYTLEFAETNLPSGTEEEAYERSVENSAEQHVAGEERSEALEDRDLGDHFVQTEPPNLSFDEPEHSVLNEDPEMRDLEFEDSTEDEATELLRAEIRELQCELAERDAQLNEFLNVPTDTGFVSNDLNESPDESSLVNRLDELLDELTKSDERSALLEEMLRASEEATAAEQEERRQLDSWVSDIEQRVSQREAEWQAELERHQKRATQAREERNEIEKRLRNTASASDAKLAHDRVLENLREKNAELEEKLTKTESARAALEQELQSVEVQSTIDAQQTVVDVATREERAQLAKERAEFSRMRAELTNKLAEIEHEVQRSERGPSEVDEKIRVLRNHLREIHGNEKRERGDCGVPGEPGKRGLMSRISSLWKSLDG
ncbi:MAG: hypothetical protein IH991_14555 [Planctomycetes bacterium]|nr:hypothetical protein [Planctomycetota bacterium]